MAGPRGPRDSRQVSIRAAIEPDLPSSNAVVSGERSVSAYTSQLSTPSCPTMEDMCCLNLMSPSIKDLEQQLQEASNGARAEDGTTQAKNLGVGVKELVTAMSRLEGLGLSRMDIKLPKICVLGDQSAGKSSLIEAISGIRVPRSAGTCTRCPLFIKLASSDNPDSPWQAKILLRKSYEFRRSLRRPSKTVKFFEWDKKDSPVTTVFETVDDKGQLADAIFRAQLATLNPGLDPVTFGPSRPLEDGPHLQTKFSPNVVCIHISEPGLPNLSFYDLPGIITQVEDATEDHLVRFIKNLVTDYVSDPEAIILLACSMEVDMAVSNAAIIAREEGAKPRCIGILTKPDRRPRRQPAEENRELKAILSGQAFQLGHGYFVTKQPSSEEVHLSHAEARKLEESFFRTEPWSTSLKEFSHKFGTPNLQEFISRKLAAQTLHALPQIRQQISDNLEDVNAKLANIPKPETRNAMGTVFEVLRTYSQRIQKEMEGDIPYNGWHLIWQSLRESFSRQLSSMRPILVIRGIHDEDLFRHAQIQGGTGPPEGTSGGIIVLSSDDEEPQESPTKKRKMGTPSTPIMTQTPAEVSTSQNIKSEGPKNSKDPLAKRFELDVLREDLNKMSSSKIPGGVNMKAVEHFIRGTTEHWKEPVHRFYDGLEETLKQHLRKIFNEALQKWDSSELYRVSWSIISSMLSMQLSEQRITMAGEILNDEKEVYVFNKEVLEFYKSKRLNAYKQAWYNTRMKMYFKGMEETTGKQLSQIERERHVRKDEALKKLLNAEPYEREIDVMATICAYYDMASGRLHDAICMRVESKIFKTLRVSLQEELSSGLEIYGENAHDKCIELLAEDVGRERVRQFLEERKSKLLEGEKLLNELNEKYKGEDSSSTTGTSPAYSVDEEMDYS
ncbi:P-loop containing nucleoside triphosphate hydrolase protein [Delitschia confertaspora ATCC 74209]|uniref:P-loop containing nucleoside triphosphate hydrolase protein n=1 Tax=Delitschia confertaspora ATCC 74209 TaxID=1513339 RepID=A0A9P4JMQ5_9PLEO|nr:P-loop containing nucleoside triphosphate hydrolase protein [Delitschia confertaspora ATCC 74209]